MEEEYYVWLSKLRVLNSVKLKLLKQFKGIKSLYNCSMDEMVDLDFSDELIIKIVNRHTRENAKKDYEYMKKNNIDIIWYGNKFYPEKLKHIGDKPAALYVRGNKEILGNDAVCVVGSRKANQDSLNFARNISKKYAEKRNKCC